MSSIIRVEPQSIHRYAKEAQQYFDEMQSELRRIVDSVAEVDYHGVNAFEFKSAISDLAVEFASKFTKDMAIISGAVRDVTTNIVKSLGGQPVVISVEGKPMIRPTIKREEFFQVDTSALEQLGPVVKGQFEALTNSLSRHLKALENTDWQGNAKRQVVATVRDYTQKMNLNAEECSATIRQMISSQVNSTIEADRG
jgi:uncharacterized protein YukE